MATKKKVEKEEQTKKVENKTPASSKNDFTYEEYYEILMLAKKIRLENRNEIEKAKDPKEKIQLLEELFQKYHISTFTPSSKEKNKLTLLKVNIFIPDSMAFAIDYKDKYSKNIRLISEAYQIPAPFVIQKVAEISIYSSYLDRLEKEGGLGEPELFNMGAFKMLYDPDVTPAEMTKINADLKTQKTNTIVAPAEQEQNPIPSLDTPPKNSKKTEKVISTEDVPFAESPIMETEKKKTNSEDSESLSLSSIISSELQKHMQSVEQYCVRLLTEKNQFEAENIELKRKIKELETIIRELQDGKEVDIPIPSTVISSQTENNLRKQIKDLEFTNSELLSSLTEQAKKADAYKNRAIVAEVQLEQLRDNMFSIEKEVDSFGLESPNTKK